MRLDQVSVEPDVKMENVHLPEQGVEQSVLGAVEAPARTAEPHLYICKRISRQLWTKNAPALAAILCPEIGKSLGRT